MADETEAAMAAHSRGLKTPTVAMPSHLFAVQFWTFVLAIVCWIMDVLMCDVLHVALPFYPQLHAMWHLLTALGLNMAFVLNVFHRQVRAGANVEVTWFGLVLPRLVIVHERAL